MGKRSSQRVDVLRSFKMKSDKNNLEIYKSFIRHNAPRLVKYSTKLEQLQLNAPRKVTSTNHYASKQLLNCETGQETLTARRDKQRLLLFFKIIYGFST